MIAKKTPVWCLFCLVENYAVTLYSKTGIYHLYYLTHCDILPLIEVRNSLGVM